MTFFINNMIFLISCIKKNYCLMVALQCCDSCVTEQQSESTICIQVSALFWNSFPFRSPQGTEQSSLCYAVGSY